MISKQVHGHLFAPDISYMCVCVHRGCVFRFGLCSWEGDNFWHKLQQSEVKGFEVPYFNELCVRGTAAAAGVEHVDKPANSEGPIT